MTSNSDYNKLDDMFANSSDDDDVTSTPTPAAAVLPTGRSRGRKPKPKKGGSRAGMLIYVILGKKRSICMLK